MEKHLLTLNNTGNQEKVDNYQVGEIQGKSTRPDPLSSPHSARKPKIHKGGLVEKTMKGQKYLRCGESNPDPCGTSMANP